ncbi:MAG TPA: PilZ domain-containing protein [Myxococcales bacterium]|nr:PilZ domain-containing protein [Myxococcales bacterium]HIL80509.1 PilZ domain-containing protein [Myxococcales bacterium]
MNNASTRSGKPPGKSPAEENLMPEVQPQDERTRRVDPRADVHLQARISTVSPQTDPSTGQVYFRASDETCENISRKGAFVVTFEPIREGQQLLIEIDLPSGEEVSSLGRVCWSRAKLPSEADPRRPGFGVEFLRGSRKNYHLFERYVEQVIRATGEAT